MKGTTGSLDSAHTMKPKMEDLRAGQMLQRQQQFGLTQDEKEKIANAASVTRSMGIQLANNLN